MAHLLRAKAVISIDRPERYAKQLISHLGTKVAVESLADGKSQLTFGENLGFVSVAPGQIILEVSSDTEEGLDGAKDVLIRHLFKFAKREDKNVSWSVSA